MQTLKSTGCVLDVRAAPGNNFIDVSRYHHTITNNNVLTVKGMGDGLAGWYNGSTGYLDCGNPSSLKITDDITIGIWMKTIQTPTVVGMMVSRRSGDSAPQIAYDISLSSTGYGAGLINSGAGLSTWVVTSATINDDSWHHLTFVYVPSTSITIYLDGFQSGINTVSIPASLNSADIPTIIGARGGAPTYFFNGTISSVRIYNRALPAYEILDHYYEYAALLGKQ